MRYVKQEMYNFCHIWTKLMFDIYIAFLNPYNIAAIGVRDTYPTKVLFGIAAFDKVYLLGFIFYCLTSKLDYKGEKYKSLFKLQQVIHLIVVLSFVGGFYQSDHMKGQSTICIIWAKVICTEFLSFYGQYAIWWNEMLSNDKEANEGEGEGSGQLLR